ncbi:CDP-glycerol glycerophosphotransferase family protein [Streptomyces sp. SP17BM10]|uniref:CDP-glycerol glycerophosphotransferase family protein n=1 Tax=Streptomyces sp. SP17BM10 TaxID=3002530 RepID=UPI002E76E946|nr:CDP-glycerol glycerophosphotransferase family protein [Streptomyces sp. SP17BM10]MEE1784337.1 CDP-glycerol glycerophosphotransferase family protein [Streptomyces sp. SP17BM10]
MPVLTRLVLPHADPRVTTALPTPSEDADFGLLRARWAGRGLELTGFARPHDQDTGRAGSAWTWLTLRHPEDARPPVHVRSRPRRLPEITDESAQPEHNHDWSGFTAVIEPGRLRLDGQWLLGDWQIETTLFTRPRPTRVRRQYGTLAPHWCGSGEYPPARWVDRDVRLQPHFTDGRLNLLLERPGVRLTAADPVDGGLDLRGTADHCPSGTVLRLRHRESDAVVEQRVTRTGNAFAVHLPYRPFTADGRGTGDLEHWDAELRRPDGGTEQLVVDERGGPVAGQHRLPGTADRALYLKHLADGRLQVCVQPAAGMIDRISVKAGAFELAGHCPDPAAGRLELVLRHTGTAGEVRRPVEAGADGRFRVRVPATRTGSDGTSLPLRKGIWEAALEPADRSGPTRPLLAAPGALAALPAATQAGGKPVLLQRRWHDTLLVDSTPVLTATERSAWTQSRLRADDYPAARREPLREAVLYDVFGGRGYADSPRAVHAELVRRDLPLEHLWVVDDAQADLPPGVTAVRIWSPEWYRALATCRYLVGNTHFPDFLERRRGQVVVQTWHGSLLKRIAHDVENPWLADHGYLDALDRETPQWSVLVSPSPFATPILRRAFRYGGEILEAGYPRNDVLARPDERTAAAVRRRLGIPEGKRIVLYAPTWREDQQRGDGDGFRLDLRIGVEHARRALGQDHVLLIRPHAHVREPLPGAGDGFLYDCADYPDVQELLLVADVLVTDYSSIMFDFAITGRPVLFFTYDLEHYRDTLRGFYFDFETQAPGPLVPDSVELIGALRELADGDDGLTDRYAERYRRFRAAHCALDDGGAARRVVDRMLELTRTAS